MQALVTHEWISTWTYGVSLPSWSEEITCQSFICHRMIVSDSLFSSRYKTWSCCIELRIDMWWKRVGSNNCWAFFFSYWMLRLCEDPWLFSKCCLYIFTNLGKSHTIIIDFTVFLSFKVWFIFYYDVAIIILTLTFRASRCEMTTFHTFDKLIWSRCKVDWLV